MNYASLSNLSKSVKQLIARLPQDIDLIVGIPRDGMLAASLLALYLDLPLTDVESFCSRKIFQSRTGKARGWGFSKCKTVLVVDDCIGKGDTMQKVKDLIAGANLPTKIYYAVIYAKTKEPLADFYGVIQNPPRLAEWNWPERAIIREWCIDIDGVLCRNPTREENDDGESYRKFLTNVGVSIRPTLEIGWIVTGRLDKYRSLTERWLREHSIRYKHLVMFDPMKYKSRADFKAQIYRGAEAKLFIESSPKQAEEIAKKSGKEVLCLGDNKVYR